MVYKRKIKSILEVKPILKNISKKKKIPLETLKRRSRVSGQSVLEVDI